MWLGYMAAGVFECDKGFGLRGGVSGVDCLAARVGGIRSGVARQAVPGAVR